MVTTIPTVLTIAGSDSGGGAGVQADLKALARCGVHGTCAITAITAQSTTGVEAVHAVPPEMIAAQVSAVADDFELAAVKVGMLGDEPTVGAVATALRELAGIPIVVDPVMVAESGAVLLEPKARRALIDLVLPQATVITPNLPEARELAEGVETDEPAALSAALLELGPEAVIVTGGHSDGGADWLARAGSAPLAIDGERHPDGASHGSGCTHSSALAAQLARGAELEAAAREARRIAAEAVRDGLSELGRGAGPVDALGIASRAG